jgi:nitrite reductase/ring-hydroxylating ferredoxin subunit
MDGRMMLRLCAVADVPIGEIRRFEKPDGRALAVYNVGGKIFVTDDLCTHGDASLSEGEIEDGNVVCPYHLGKFDIRSGTATGAPCSISLRIYDVTIDGGDVLITA